MSTGRFHQRGCRTVGESLTPKLPFINTVSLEGRATFELRNVPVGSVNTSIECAMNRSFRVRHALGNNVPRSIVPQTSFVNSRLGVSTQSSCTRQAVDKTHLDRTSKNRSSSRWQFLTPFAADLYRRLLQIYIAVRRRSYRRSSVFNADYDIACR